MINKSLPFGALKHELEANIGPDVKVEIGLKDLIGCLNWRQGFDSVYCLQLVHSLVDELHGETVRRTFSL